MAVDAPRARPSLAWGIWAALLVVDVAYVAVFGDEVPFWDDWAFVPPLTGGRPITLSLPGAADDLRWDWSVWTAITLKPAGGRRATPRTCWRIRAGSTSSGLDSERRDARERLFVYEDAHTLAESLRPKLRGVIHHYAFFASLAAGVFLLTLAPDPRALTVAAVYGASLCALFGTSALYHRVTWSPRARRWMGRLDHSMIGVLIAGTYTPFGALALSGTIAAVLLAVMWCGALGNILLHVLWLDAPKWVSAASYVALGWVGAVAMPDLVVHTGWTPTLLLLAGGLFYSAGALVYALRRPDPLPAVFGYHEVFHALVVVAAIAHYAAVTLTILPRAS
jgi:hemolysin III